MIPATESLRIAEPDGRLTGSIGWPARSAFCCTSFRAAPDVMALGMDQDQVSTVLVVFSVFGFVECFPNKIPNAYYDCYAHKSKWDQIRKDKPNNT